MMIRTQIALDSEQHRRARDHAGQLGISLAEYLRRLVAKDLGGSRRSVDPSPLFDLGDSGGSDIALHKDEYIGQAVSAGRSRREG